MVWQVKETPPHPVPAPLILAKQDGGVPGGNLLRPEAGNV